MATIEVRHPIDCGAAEAKAALDGFSAYLAKYKIRLVWQGDHADIKGPGISGSVRIDPSAVSVSAKLGLMAKAAGIKADKVEASIRKRLAESLGG